jgi:hypothetical protein
VSRTPKYRYLLCDLRTDRPLAELPLTGVGFDRRISRTGSLQGKFECPTEHLVDIARLCYENAGRAALWVYRDNAIWWGGILWTAPVDEDDRGSLICSVTASTFDSYAHHRVLYEDHVYRDIDPGHIIAGLWRAIQANPYGDIGLVAADQDTGVLMDATYPAAAQAYVGKLIEDLGDLSNGPEHTIDTYLDGSGVRVKELRAARQLGLRSPRVVFSRARGGGGRLVKWNNTADAVSGGTSFQAQGDAPATDLDEQGAPSVSDRVQRLDLLNAGWPLIDVVQDYPGVASPTLLNAYANGMANNLGGNVAARGYTIAVETSDWSPNRIGDYVRIKINDRWHGNADMTVRPVGCSVKPPERGQAEQVTLLLGDDE